MRKICIAAFLLLIPYVFFAKSNINLLGGFANIDKEYTKNNSIYKVSEEPKLCLGISNYNYFIFKNHFGVFERAFFSFSENFSIDNIFGGCAQIKPTKRITIEGGPSFHIYCKFFEKNSNENIDIYLGFTQNAQLKIDIWKKLSTVVGFDFSVDPYSINLSKESNQWYYEQIKNFICINFSPYIGISYNF